MVVGGRRFLAASHWSVVGHGCGVVGEDGCGGEGGAGVVQGHRPGGGQRKMVG